MGSGCGLIQAERRMSGIFDRLDNKKRKDTGVLANFIYIYCRQKHRAASKDAFTTGDERLRKSLGNKDLVLCHECRKLLNHSIAKLVLCPYDPNPACRKCPTYCYAPDYRERIGQVMRFSRMYLIRRGRMDLILRYLR